MLGLNVFAADTDEDARLLFTSLQQAFVNLRTGHPGQLPPPLAGYEDQLEPRLADMLANVLRCAIVGGPATIAEGLSSFIAAHRPDEIMVTAQIYDPAARRKSYDILSNVHSPDGFVRPNAAPAPLVHGPARC
jgi:alkanesulfonate monooxygenase SsuD/methylene tetrahydromethanopterin reductase-like flavin-dependent oxidoreductase (luciferase family)